VANVSAYADLRVNDMIVIYFVYVTDTDLQIEKIKTEDSIIEAIQSLEMGST